MAFRPMGVIAALMLGLLGAAAVPASAGAVPDVATAVQIDVGGSGSGDFITDSFGTGGVTDSKPATRPSLPNWRVPHPIPADVWHTARHLESTYTVTDLEPGSYQVRLYFMDWFFTRTGQRIFDVAINGDKVLTDFDIIGTAVAMGADGGAAFGIEKFFPVTVDASGTVTVEFLRGAVNQPQINAIAIVPVA